MDCLGSPTTNSLPGSRTTSRQSRGHGLALAEEEDDLRLQRVGVLELVDQQVAEARLQRRPRVEVARRAGRAGSPSRSVKSSRPRASCVARRPARERVGDGHGERREEGGVGLARGEHLRRPPPVPRLQLVLAAVRRAPVALGAARARVGVSLTGSAKSAAASWSTSSGGRSSSARPASTSAIAAMQPLSLDVAAGDGAVATPAASRAAAEPVERRRAGPARGAAPGSGSRS